MIRYFLYLLLITLTVGCVDTQGDKAGELYDMVDKYGRERRYDDAIEILQRIRIDYENTEYATLAEQEISKYQGLKEMLVDNKARSLEGNFQSIGVALENYRARYQAFPVTRKGVEKLSEVMVPKWEDPWGNIIHYKPLYSSPDIPRHMPDGYVLGCFGKDGLPGGEGLDKDYFFQNNAMVERISMN